jgi:hypothetical protein
MFWIFEIIIILYGLYCFTFCATFMYTAIIEEWCCQNKIPIWLKIKNYQQIDKTVEIEEV